MLRPLCVTSVGSVHRQVQIKNSFVGTDSTQIGMKPCNTPHSSEH
jgi:hypothetical protein